MSEDIKNRLKEVSCKKTGKYIYSTSDFSYFCNR